MSGRRMGAETNDFLGVLRDSVLLMAVPSPQACKEAIVKKVRTYLFEEEERVNERHEMRTSKSNNHRLNGSCFRPVSGQKYECS